MKFLTDLLPHLFVWCLIGAGLIFVLFMVLGALGYLGQILFVIFYPLYAITLKPVIWAISKVFQSRCPQCKGFFKKKLVDWQKTDEHEARRTINRVDEGVLYSNNLFALNQGFEINRQEQVNFVERTFTNTWQCKDPTCGHQWKTEEYTKEEGSLNP